MGISKEYIRYRLSALSEDTAYISSAEVVKRGWKARLRWLFSKTIIYKYRHNIKAKILSIPYLKPFIMKHKKQLLKMPIIKNIISLFR